MKQEFIRVGRIVNAHGIRGEVRVQPRRVSPALLTRCKTFYIDGQPVTPTANHVHKELVLLKLPGVGRKTANLVLGDIYKKPGAVVADTHCIRISGRLGLTDGTKDPVKVEQQLRPQLPPEESNDFCHRLVYFGRDVCIARRPQCAACELAHLCPSRESV